MQSANSHYQESLFEAHLPAVLQNKMCTLQSKTLHMLILARWPCCQVEAALAFWKLSVFSWPPYFVFWYTELLLIKIQTRSPYHQNRPMVNTCHCSRLLIYCAILPKLYVPNMIHHDVVMAGSMLASCRSRQHHQKRQAYEDVAYVCIYLFVCVCIYIYIYPFFRWCPSCSKPIWAS